MHTTLRYTNYVCNTWCLGSSHFDKINKKVLVRSVDMQCGMLYVYFFLSSFSLGSFSLCFLNHVSLMAYCTIIVLDIPTLCTSLALPRHLSRESWSCNPVNVSNFRHRSSFRDPGSQRWKYVGEKWPVNLA
jgi:hypothetical protein